MDEPIEEVYFKWLYSKVASTDNPTPSLTFWTLIRDLHATEFVWLIPGDDNRAQDGLDVRREFLTALYLPQDPAWMNIPCSVMEMIFAFSRRAEFETEMSARDWFWIFMENLELAKLNDASNRITERTYRVLDRFVWRTYHDNGKGGMFPLHHPHHDQRKIEIWYQFCAYLVDQEEYG